VSALSEQGSSIVFFFSDEGIELLLLSGPFGCRFMLEGEELECYVASMLYQRRERSGGVLINMTRVVIYQDKMIAVIFSDFFEG
jgi:hypothetical protein